VCQTSGAECAHPSAWHFFSLIPFLQPFVMRARGGMLRVRAWTSTALSFNYDKSCVPRSASTGAPTPGEANYTGHSSSFHAISQNIHSYRELITNDSSIRRFSSLPAVLAHRSTFWRIHRCTSANSGEAYSISHSR
jgi:hypothetical protein